MQDQGEKRQVMLNAWEPAQVLRTFEAAEVRYSRGFLRCRPEKWFPGFAMQWLPPAHSLGVELKLVEAKPVISTPRGAGIGFVGSIDDEPIGIFIDNEAANLFLRAVVPEGSKKAKEVVLEYLARRLLSSLAISWSGPESSLMRFEPDMNLSAMREVAAVKLTIGLNGEHLTVYILLGKIVVEKMDGLWRRQLHSTAAQNGNPLNLHLEAAHLTVPPSILSDYLKRGVAFDLEVGVSDMMTLVVNGQPWLPVRLGCLDGRFVVQTTGGPIQGTPLPPGTSRLSFDLGRFTFDPALVAEMNQVNALYETGIGVTDHVQIMVNGEQAGEAVLRVYQGRFVISVL